MYQKTEGILLNLFQYKESSLILSFYSKHLGFVDCMAKGVYSKHELNKNPGHFHLLNMFELVIFLAPHKRIHSLEDYSCNKGGVGKLFADPIKLQYSYMFSELLLLITKKESQPNNELFQFIKEFWLFFYSCESNYFSLFVYFFFKILFYLGLSPLDMRQNKNKLAYLNVEKGIFTNDITPYQANFFFMCDSIEFRNVHELNIPKKERSTMMQALLTYYKYHFYHFDELKSYTIFQEIYS